MGEQSSSLKKFFQVMSFGIGFISATALMFSVVALGLIIVTSIFDIQYTLMWIVVVIAMLFGLNLLGFNIFKFLKIKVETKPLIQRLTRKHVFTFFGLITLGFLFYFLDPCIAPMFIAVIEAFDPPSILLEFLPLLLFIFCLGAVIPFFGIGLLASSISKLTRSTYRHRFKIRAISGLILIGYSLYLVILYLLPIFH
jgi:cytochrome c biogenesis protein CcdA